MKLPPSVCPRPYTRLAFEGLFYAQEKEVDEKYADLVYRAYFEKELDIGKIDILCALAEQSGLNKTEFRQVLVSGSYSANVKKEVEHSRNVLKVTGIPSIYLNGEKIAIEEYTK